MVQKGQPLHILFFSNSTLVRISLISEPLLLHDAQDIVTHTRTYLYKRTHISTLDVHNISRRVACPLRQPCRPHDRRQRPSFVRPTGSARGIRCRRLDNHSKLHGIHWNGRLRAARGSTSAIWIPTDSGGGIASPLSYRSFSRLHPYQRPALLLPHLLRVRTYDSSKSCYIHQHYGDQSLDGRLHHPAAAPMRA